MASPSLKPFRSLPSSFPTSMRPTSRKVSFDFRNSGFSLKSPPWMNLSFGSKPVCQSHEFAVSPSAVTADAPLRTTEDKLRLLVSEFRSLSEPIDRVKRLLLYAAALAPFDDSARVPANRVPGCTTQVWLDIRMDESGKMRLRADSDSEISKGFCSCLIWILDGAEAEEVIAVNGDDLSDMNVGVHGKAKSRVNTWHNVLISMQKRTIALVSAAERGQPGHLLPRFPPHPLLPVTGDGSAYINGSCMESSVY